MKLIYCFLFLYVLVACENEDSGGPSQSIDVFDAVADKNINNKTGYLLDSSAFYADSVIRKYIQETLNTTDEENFTYTIHKAALNPDKAIDAIISVNRLAYAKQTAIESGHVAQAEKLAYMGPFNAFIFFDGRSNSFSIPVPVPSSPLLPLDISFANISSNEHKDLVVDFRIRNSSYKEVYFLFNNKPSKVFQWKNFDGLGKPNSEAYRFSFNPGNGPARDIVVYKAEIETPKGEINPFIFKPQILNSTEMLKKFFYVPAQGKYFSTKDGPEG
jgi:hypothetical protein